MSERRGTPGHEPALLLAVGTAALIASRVGAYDPTTWLMEVFPILIAVPILIATRRRFPLTPLLYRLILLHAVILMVGGHYTYARVPLGFWFERALHLARNHYDRLGHLAQGFVPALVAREILLRKSPLGRGGWLYFVVVCICLAISAFYELIEWWAALAFGAGARAFLGTQGDPWDTQWDMFMAFIGANLALLLLGRYHDQQLEGAGFETSGRGAT